MMRNETLRNNAKQCYGAKRNTGCPLGHTVTALIQNIRKGRRREMPPHKVTTSKVVKRFGQWVVTSYGVECLDHYYPIEAYRGTR